MVVGFFNIGYFREANRLLCCVAADNQQGTVQTVILKEMMNCSVFTEAVGTVTSCFPIAMKGIRRCILKLHTLCLEPLTKWVQSEMALRDLILLM